MSLHKKLEKKLPATVRGNLSEMKTSVCALDTCMRAVERLLVAEEHADEELADEEHAEDEPSHGIWSRETIEISPAKTPGEDAGHVDVDVDVEPEIVVAPDININILRSPGTS